jgi:hypothetical protein
MQIDFFPNATVAEHGTYNLLSFDRLHKIKSEIYSRGPVAVRNRGFVDKNILHRLIYFFVWSLISLTLDRRKCQSSSGIQGWCDQDREHGRHDHGSYCFHRWMGGG